ncbi:MAG: DnaJ domain-containing protein [Planctomycetota bacterium]
MLSPLQADKRRSQIEFVLAVTVVLIGVRAVGTSWALSAFPVVALGVYVASHAFARLTRIQAVERELLTQARADFAREFRRSTLPRQVYWLLLAVAEADGAAGEPERALVRQFVLDRFPPDDVRDIARWHEERLTTAQVGPLARSMRETLSRSETETVFFWACLVTFADQRFNEREREALRDAAKGLGLDPQQARRIFWHAKHSYLGRGSRHGDGERASSTRTGPTSARERALQILGLDETASDADVRTRYRLLAKKFHPDRHIHLGDAAAQEAAARFREVQAAYEELRA